MLGLLIASAFFFYKDSLGFEKPLKVGIKKPGIFSHDNKIQYTEWAQNFAELVLKDFS